MVAAVVAVPLAPAWAASRPVVSGVSPAAGPIKGGAVVVVSGKNFTGTTRVMFGTTRAAKVRVLSSRRLQVTTPAHAAGTVHVRVVARGGTSSTVSADRYTYLAVPAVSAVAPATGPASGGTVVVVSGANLTGASAVTFGGSAGTSLRVLSSGRLQVTAPTHAAAAVDVRVTTPGGTSPVVSGDRYTYQDTAFATVQRSCVDSNALTGFVTGLGAAAAGQVQLAVTTPGGSFQPQVTGRAPTFVYAGRGAGQALPAGAFSATWTLMVNGATTTGHTQVGTAAALNCHTGSLRVTSAALSADKTRLYLGVAAVGMVAPSDASHGGLEMYALTATGNDGSSFSDAEDGPSVWDGDELASASATGGTYNGTVTLTPHAAITGNGPATLTVRGFADDPSVDAALPNTTATLGSTQPPSVTLSVTGVTSSADCATVSVSYQATGLTPTADYNLKRAPGFTQTSFRATGTTSTGILALEALTITGSSGTLATEASNTAPFTVPTCTPAS
jgi:hypothetical protein